MEDFYGLKDSMEKLYNLGVDKDSVAFIIFETYSLAGRALNFPTLLKEEIKYLEKEEVKGRDATNFIMGGLEQTCLEINMELFPPIEKDNIETVH